jgi:hypothetical protein
MSETAFRKPNSHASPRGFRLSGAELSQLSRRDNAFHDFAWAANHELHVPTLVEMHARCLPQLVPQWAHDFPLWVIWLPHQFAYEIEAISLRLPKAGSISSTDLLKRRLTLEWTSSENAFFANAKCYDASISHAQSAGCLVQVVMSANKLSLQVFGGIDDLLIDLQTIGTNCGLNYRPIREHTQEELAAALHASVILGNTPSLDWDGRNFVHLRAVHYRRTASD